MKYVVTVSLGIILVGMTAFGFIKGETTHSKSEELEAKFTCQIDSRDHYFDFKISNLKMRSANRSSSYLVRRNSARPIAHEKLRKAISISDIIENYPSNWIKHYRSVEISTKLDGKEVVGEGADHVLTVQQKNILNSVDLSEKIGIKVRYKTKNGVTNMLENREMNVSVGVLPTIEAEYIGGYDQMIMYLQENTPENIRKAVDNFDPTQVLSIEFAVGEDGRVSNTQLVGESGDQQLDLFFVELISKMPKWRPAKNTQGLPVKQKFDFVVGMDGC